MTSLFTQNDGQSPFSGLSRTGLVFLPRSRYLALSPSRTAVRPCWPPRCPSNAARILPLGRFVLSGPCVWNGLSSDTRALFPHHCRLVSKHQQSRCEFTTQRRRPRCSLHPLLLVFSFSKVLIISHLFVCCLSPLTRMHSQPDRDFNHVLTALFSASHSASHGVVLDAYLRG